VNFSMGLLEIVVGCRVKILRPRSAGI